MENLDYSIDPCDNFYKFACGKFINSIVIPDDKTYVDAFSFVEDRIQVQLKDALEEEIKHNETRHVKIIKTFYKNCINEIAINEKGLQTAIDILKKLGGWPVLEGDSWREENFNWQQLVYKFKRESIPLTNFFESGVVIDSKNSSKRVLYIDQPLLDLTHENIKQGFSNNVVEAYYKYMIDIAVDFGADETKAKWELKKSLELEMNLVNISTPEDRDESVLYSLTIEELEKKYTSMSWKQYFNSLLNLDNQIDENDSVLVKNPTFFSEFEKLIEHVPKRDQANFIMWKVVKGMISYLDDNVRMRELRYLTDTVGQKEREPRWKECVLHAMDNFGHSIGSIYVNKYFNRGSRSDVREMFENIRDAFGNLLRRLNWVDDVTKKYLLDKLESMGAFIAYADEHLDDGKIDEFYEKLEITIGDHVESMLNLTLFNTNYLLGLWKKPVDKESWTFSVSPVIVDAFYSLNIDSILVPGGILQGAFYSKDRPSFMNYGAIGFLIAHEITHFFDINMKKIAEEKAKKYISKVECFIQQYENYTAEDVSLNLNGRSTQRENIADNGGIEIAYLAYKKWVEVHGPEMIYDTKLTQSQLFWISTAQIWCTKYRPKELINKISNDIYSPAEFRVLGSFSNRPEFAKDFNCSSDSKMIAKNICSVW
ncbi:neprilysin-2-like [Leptopilina heterotoma]|uniref:neprilysin-2-like n=1 Tax=Leptopilina heterotoma TaxID=63436 RepID=UPI001CA92081|nr:neprilysin-2-like [Leptopilina heterotoma]